jgi:hypothetical protein
MIRHRGLRAPDWQAKGSRQARVVKAGIRHESEAGGIYIGEAQYLYADRGNPFENVEHAESILAGIRHQLTKKPRDVVLARYLPLASAKFSVRSWLPHWLAHFEAQVTAGQRSPGTPREYRRYAADGGAFDALRDSGGGARASAWSWGSCSDS